MAEKEQPSSRFRIPPLRWVLLGVDILCFAAAAAAVALMMLKVNPFTRGFYCDDRSISKPYKKDTISRGFLVSMCCLLPAIVIIVTETFYFFKNFRKFRKDVMCWRAQRNSSSLNVLEMYIVFLFGAIFTVLLTNIGKYSTGVLRPHFLEVCKPDLSRLNCSSGFIVHYVCAGNSKLIKEARLSFPSAHASLAAYAMGFVALYVESRIRISRSKLLKPTIQLAAIALALGTAYSRVSDYQHHWPDVVAGLVLGVLMAALFSCRVLRLNYGRSRRYLSKSAVSVATIDTQL